MLAFAVGIFIVIFSIYLGYILNLWEEIQEIYAEMDKSLARILEMLDEDV